MCTVGQVCLHRLSLHRLSAICGDLLRRILILHFFAKSEILLTAIWSLTEAIACPSYLANIVVSLENVKIVVLSDVGRPVVWIIRRALQYFFTLRLLQFPLKSWFLLRILLEEMPLLNMILILCSMSGKGFL
jgi:hypothetical protein